MSSDKAKKKLTNGGAGGDDAAVEELLRAAQDDFLLKLRVNSHSISDDSHFASLDPDLMRRFDALKTKPSVPSSSNCEVDDLESRFAKLKGGVASDHAAGSGGSEPGMEDEVEKLMQWAMDAARLDLAGGESTGEDEVGEIVSTESSDEEESDEDEIVKGKKTKTKGNSEKKKWFFLISDSSNE